MLPQYPRLIPYTQPHHWALAAHGLIDATLMMAAAEAFMLLESHLLQATRTSTNHTA